MYYMANTTSYMLKFGADATSVTKAITGVNSDIRSMSTQAKNLDTAFRLTGDTSALKGKLQALGNQLSATEAKAKLLKQELANLKASPGFDANSAKAQKLTNDIAKTESEATKLKAQLATASTSSLDGASSSMGGLTKKIGAGTVAMGTFVGSIASNIAGKAFSLISSNVEGAIKRIDTLNNSTRNFQNMGVKTSVVTKEMENLKSAINGLPTPLDSAVSGVQLLTSSLNGDMPQSVSVFKALNDGILGFGGTTEQVTNSITQLSQAFSNGKIDAETWNSMIDSGLGPTLNAMAKQMGITTDALKSGLSDGSISVSQFNDALVNLDKNGGGGIASLSKIAQDSTSGIRTSMANAKTAVNRGVAEMITGINNGIAGLNIETPLGKIEDIGSIISQLGTVVEKTFDGMASRITPTITGIGSALSGMFSGFNAQDAMSVFSQISGSIMEMVDDVRNIDFSNLTSAFSNLDIQLPDFSPLMDLASSIVPMLGDAFSSLKFDGLVDLANQIIPALSAGFQSFLGWVVPAIQPLLSAFSNLWNAIQPVLSIVAGSLVPIFQVLGSFLGGFVSGVMSTLTFAFNALAVGIKLLTPVIGFMGQAFNALSPIISFIAGILGTVMGASVNVLGKIFSTVGQAISSVWSRLSGVFSSVAGTMSGIFSSIGSAFSALGSIFSSIGSGIGSAGRAIASVFSSVGGRLGGIFSGISSAFSSVGGVIAGVGGRIGVIAGNIIGYFGGIGGRILSGFGNIGSSIANLFSGVVGRIGSMFSGVASIGRNIVEGIKSGITGAIGGLVSTAADMAKHALNAAKHALGIHSPSRVFRDEVGKYITQGIGVGMEKETGYLSKSSDSVKNSLLSDWQNVNLNSNLTSGINSSPQGVSTDTSGTNNVFNITANTKADASAIASEVKVILRQNGIAAR